MQVTLDAATRNLRQGRSQSSDNTLMSTPAFLAAAVVLGLAGAFALIKHRSKKTIPRLPDAKLD